MACGDTPSPGECRISEIGPAKICAMAKRAAPGAGRPSKGDRDVFMTRVPRAVGDAVRQRAEDLDLSFSECIADLLAAALDMSEHAIAVKDRAQQELPLKSA